jgi:hypothetical protein
MMVRQAITTKYIPQTNTREARIRARAAAGSIIVNWQSGHNVEENHRMAALQFAQSKDWVGSWYQGSNHEGTGYVFVCLDRREATGCAFKI